jgi:hypothetical protein
LRCALVDIVLQSSYLDTVTAPDDNQVLAAAAVQMAAPRA